MSNTTTPGFGSQEAKAWLQSQRKHDDNPTPSAASPVATTLNQAAITALGEDRTVHSFSKALAEEHGITAAVLLKYLAVRVTRSKNLHKGVLWHYETLDDLAARYPYLSKSALHATLKKLTKKVLLKDRFPKRRNNKTSWYAFRDLGCAFAAKTKLLYFDAEFAGRFGIHEAILLHNIQYWVKENRKKQPSYEYHEVSPTDLATLLPISRASIARALENLVEQHVLIKDADSRSARPRYKLTPEYDPNPRQASTSLLLRSNLETERSTPNIPRSEQDGRAQV